MGRLTDDMKRVVREQRLGFVATVSPDGTPNLSPKGTLAVWDDGHLVFANLYSPQTVENLAHNPSIEINVVDVFSRKGYRFKGTAEVLITGARFEEIMAMYRGETGEAPIRDAPHRVHGIVLITVNVARPLISPAYDNGASEAEVVAQWERYWATLSGRRRATTAR